MVEQSETQKKSLTLIQSYYIAQQQTSELPALYIPTTPTALEQTPPSQIPTTSIPPQKKKKTLRILAIVLAPLLILLIYIIWRPAAPTGNTTQSFANFSTVTVSTNTNTFTNTSTSIQVYITGAVQHSGVYTLASGARVYQLLQAAGGPLPQANLAAINMAARLNDGGEVYVALIGETPPVTANTNTGSGITSTGTTAGSTGGNSAQAVNINSATADELRQHLAISSKTAQNIVNYRLQHGPFTSVDELTQCLSKAIYTKIKGMVTV